MRRTKSQLRYDKYEVLRARLIDIYRKHVQFKSTADDLQADVLRSVYEDPTYRKLTIEQRSMLREVSRVWRDRIWELHVTWRLGDQSGPLPEGVDGWYLEKDTREPITFADVQSNRKESLFGFLSREHQIFGGHYWAGTDRPYTSYKNLNEPKEQAS